MHISPRSYYFFLTKSTFDPHFIMGKSLHLIFPKSVAITPDSYYVQNENLRIVFLAEEAVIVNNKPPASEVSEHEKQRTENDHKRLRDSRCQ